MFDVCVNFKVKFFLLVLNYYLDCFLKFYYRYVVGFFVFDEVSVEIDFVIFGSIFYYVVEYIYKDLIIYGKVINKEVLEMLLCNEVKL